MSVISRTFFPLHILLWTAERMSDRNAVQSQAKQIVTNVLKLCKDAVMRAINDALVVPLSQYRERERERERESKLTNMSTKSLSRIKELGSRRSSRLRSHRALRQSLTTLTSVLFGEQLMKCMGERRYDSSCIQLYTCIIFGAGTQIVPEQNMCQPLWYWVGHWGGCGNSKREC